MKLHTKLLAHEVRNALQTVKDVGQVADDVHFVQFDYEGSKSRDNGYLVQLGTYDQCSGPKNSRHYKNSGTHGASDIWAATYEEWGWFIAEIFALDPDAIFGAYKSLDSFNEQTSDQFRLPVWAYEESR